MLEIFLNIIYGGASLGLFDMEGYQIRLSGKNCVAVNPSYDVFNLTI
jgi:hypothetical protein